MPSKCKCGKSRPYFGFPGEKPTWCSKCPEKSKEAINVVNKKCECGKSQPYFGLPGEKPIWCSKCPEKSKEATNVKNKKCRCGKSQPYFGLQDGKPEWCSKCKPKEASDIKNKKCQCGKNLVFGLLGQKAEFCGTCKPEDAVNVVSKKCKCGKQPYFGFPGQKAIWCGDCKPQYTIDVKNKICSGYDGVPCPVRTQLTYGKQYCLSCDPDESRRLPRKKDEHAFFCFLDKHDIDVTQREYRIDYKCVDTSKSHAFIDGVIITPDIVICLEVDEDAHKSYACDEARTNFASTELLLAFPEHHIAWVRVNPTIGNFDRGDKALRLRDERYFEAILSIRDLIQNPRTEIIYIGYE
ncbi:hypothetical protein PBCVKS1B_550L [Paramecium bursaria Chlorella virus KS1B]|uniref:Uncharacterized protein n=2 Tax=Chlorovirus TaxID=181083 RepID=O41046_PBCV1|nr:hypothetical protein PBCV1_A564L [Paramecium bursaria Chlorella virus 1]AAC96920.1 hypothetical protein [Paramecium bursaria Chlorella virus 1]AGE54006.1 hypothetical protein PBCVIL3A_627L [Paramecium bursaria Chlorella virus IL3A]AGE54695.1 hypothetical protein PBCVKS1B_550L [Paramecium bursaria Chlorella virus KS1B]AGE57441.1 hypothetical protein PBCVNEJV4_652L [Paramecium bursaria Chlorella virus NE-JV-4]